MLQTVESKRQETQSTGNILIVDDDTDFVWVLSTLLNLHGYRVNPVSSGIEALKSLQSNTPDVIILDINMPGMDGWETYQQLRGQSNIPVLILTGFGHIPSTARYTYAGMNDIMQKPFHSDELLARIEALMNQKSRSANVGGQQQKKTIITRPTVSVIIPTLNEVKNLPLILPYLPMDFIDEVILVDGRSTDGTAEVARQMMPAIKIVMEKKPGKGAALIAGYRASSSEIIIVMDADGSNDPREIPRFINALMQGGDFVKGSRFAPGGGTSDMPRLRRWGNAAFVHMVNLLFNSTFTDLCYGYHAFWSYCLYTLDLEGVDGFEIDTALYLRAINDKLKIMEVPSFEGYRFYGVGKLRTFPDGARVLRTIFKEYFRSVLHPCHDLQMGFKGEATRQNEIFPVYNTKESLYHR